MAKSKNNKKDGTGAIKKNPIKIGDKIKHVFTPRSQLMVATFTLTNGDIIDYVVAVKNNTFKCFGGMYYADERCMIFNRSYNMHQSFYHQELSIPVRIEIPANEIKTKIHEAVDMPYARVASNIDPNVLIAWNKSKVIQDSIIGQKGADRINKLTTMMWVIGAMGLVTMLIAINGSGLF